MLIDALRKQFPPLPWRSKGHARVLLFLAFQSPCRCCSARLRPGTSPASAGNIGTKLHRRYGGPYRDRSAAPDTKKRFERYQGHGAQFNRDWLDCCVSRLLCLSIAVSEVLPIRCCRPAPTHTACSGRANIVAGQAHRARTSRSAQRFRQRTDPDLGNIRFWREPAAERRPVSCVALITSPLKELPRSPRNTLRRGRRSRGRLRTWTANNEPLR
jgi:hypothetical protein